MVGTAAATLIGLLFVGLSLNAEVVTGKANADLRMLARQTFASFMLVLVFALLFLVPQQGSESLGLPLLCLDAFGLYSTVSRFRETRRKPPRAWGSGSLTRRFVLPALCFVVLFIVAVSVLLGQTSGLYWLVPVLIALIFDASLNAWDLLLRLREPSETP